MHCRVYTAEIARALTARRHINSQVGAAWRAGFRASQASPTTARVWHDGPDEQQYLDQYATVLQAAGYTVNLERPARKRPSIRITRQN
ncbi:hypothetical protein [Streptomyces sp. NPDC088258]|uniref:hypothetical protein n=1 Tax=Streptomyces sp. NPDC088258 TaxID=3365849 RepID=UPI0037FB4241